MPRGRHAKKISFTHWTFAHGSFGPVSAGVAGLALFPATHEPETLLRLRGNLMASIRGTSAPVKHVSVGIGLILVPEGTGTTVLWSPQTDGDAPWIWVENFDLSYDEQVTDVISNQMQAFRAVIDNKAMRIMRNQETQLVMENTTINGAGSVDVSVVVRALTGK